MSSTDTILEVESGVHSSEDSPCSTSPGPMTHGPPKHEVALVSTEKSLKNPFDEPSGGHAQHCPTLTTSGFQDISMEDQLAAEDRDYLHLLYDILDVNILNWELTHEGPGADYWPLPVPVLDERLIIVGTSVDKTDIREAHFRLSQYQIISRFLIDKTKEIIYGTMIGDAHFKDGACELYFGTDRKVYCMDKMSDPIPFTWQGVKVLSVAGGYDLLSFGKDNVID